MCEPITDREASALKESLDVFTFATYDDGRFEHPIRALRIRNQEVLIKHIDCLYKYANGTRARAYWTEEETKGYILVNDDFNKGLGIYIPLGVACTMERYYPPEQVFEDKPAVKLEQVQELQKQLDKGMSTLSKESYGILQETIDFMKRYDEQAKVTTLHTKIAWLESEKLPANMHRRLFPDFFFRYDPIRSDEMKCMKCNSSPDSFDLQKSVWSVLVTSDHKCKRTKTSPPPTMNEQSVICPECTQIYKYGDEQFVGLHPLWVVQPRSLQNEYIPHPCCESEGRFVNSNWLLYVPRNVKTSDDKRGHPHGSSGASEQKRAKAG